MISNAVLRLLNRLRRPATSTTATLVDRLANIAFGAGHHLIVYGSLSPGGPNHGHLAMLGGTWERGWVEGELEEVGWGAQIGFPALRWHPGGPRVTAHLLCSGALPGHWAALDGFEGTGYERILAPFHSERGSTSIGYLYAAAPPPVT